MLSIGNLVDTNAQETLKAVSIKLFGHQALGDAAYCRPSHVNQLGHRGLVEALGQEPYDIFEGLREVAAGPCPGYSLGAYGLASWTAKAADRTLEIEALAPHRQMAPAPHGFLESTAHLRAADRASQQVKAPTKNEYQGILLELQSANPKPWKVEQLVE
jgi:hypothetical protein